MRWLTENGRQVWQADQKYRIKWSKKAPSKGAQAVKDFIFKHCSSYIWFEEYRLPGTRLKVDFLSPTKKIAIEFHGKQHVEFNKFFHKTRAAYYRSFKRDVLKERILVANDYTLVEIFDDDLPLTRKFFEENYNILL